MWSSILTRNIIGGSPTRAMAVDSFLFMPPLYVLEGLSANFVKLSFFIAHSTTYRKKITIRNQHLYNCPTNRHTIRTQSTQLVNFTSSLQPVICKLVTTCSNNVQQLRHKFWQSTWNKFVDNLQSTCRQQAVASHDNASWYRHGHNKSVARCKQACCNLRVFWLCRPRIWVWNIRALDLTASASTTTFSWPSIG